MIKWFGTRLQRAFYPGIRRIKTHEPIVYLTFDDGPDRQTTSLVLDLLKNKNVQATFFCVGEKALKESELIKRMMADGHSIGSHSPDHDYKMFFKQKNALMNWVKKSFDQLTGLGVQDPVGFRPPAGVCTPPLVQALVELKVPLILWNLRFYDAVFTWSNKKAHAGAAQLGPGSVVLLHDARSPQSIYSFLETLSFFIDETRSRGFEFRPLTSSLLKDQ